MTSPRMGAGDATAEPVRVEPVRVEPALVEAAPVEAALVEAAPVEAPVPVVPVPVAPEQVEPEIVLSDDRSGEAGPVLTMVGAEEGGAAPVFRRGVPGKGAEPAVEEAAEGSAPEEKKRRGWMFWRRPSKRSLELAEVRRGCEKIEQVVGAIRDQLETAEKDRVVLNKTLSPLPLAVDGLKRVGETQEKANLLMQKVGFSLDRAEEKDKVFFKAMDRMGDTMSNMDMTVVGMGRAFSSIERTSKQSVDTMQRLSERLTESDRFLKEVFQRLRDAEREYGEYMRTNSRRSSIVTVTLCALLTLGIAVLAHTLGGASPNVTVLRPHVPSPVRVEKAAEPEAAPVDWQSEPAEKWSGVAGDWPVERSAERSVERSAERSAASWSPLGDLSDVPAAVGIPERLEDLLSVNKPVAE